MLYYIDLSYFHTGASYPILHYIYVIFCLSFAGTGFQLQNVMITHYRPKNTHFHSDEKTERLHLTWHLLSYYLCLYYFIIHLSFLFFSLVFFFFLFRGYKISTTAGHDHLLQAREHSSSSRLKTGMTTPHLTSLWAASSSSEAMVVPILDTVRKAARLAVKVDMMTTEKNQKPATSSRDARHRGGSPPP